MRLAVPGKSCALGATYFAGKYSDGKPNTALNINTNAVILEAMLYRHQGLHAFLETLHE